MLAQAQLAEDRKQLVEDRKALEEEKKALYVAFRRCVDYDILQR